MVIQPYTDAVLSCDETDSQGIYQEKMFRGEYGCSLFVLYKNIFILAVRSNRCSFLANTE